MNIVVMIDDIGVEVYKKWSDVEKNHALKKEDFVKHGSDWIMRFDFESYLVSKDIKLLESVATEQVFGKKKVDWTTAFATAIVTLVAVMIGGS